MALPEFSLRQLLEAGVHFGHKAHRWNPKMFPYIYSEVNNIHILDLIQSATLLKEANNYLTLNASEGKTFLFVGTKRQASTLIAQEAKRCDSYYVNHRIDRSNICKRLKIIFHETAREIVVLQIVSFFFLL